MKRNHRRLGFHNGDRGRVTQVDHSTNVLTVAIGDREVVLAADFLMGTTREGEPTLLHGYAITGHVAQGLTVEHSSCLPTRG